MPTTGARNPYQGAISAVGRILEEYDTNKTYPVYGFGAKVSVQMFISTIVFLYG